MPSKLPSRLVLSRHQIYYLRVKRDGKETRVSLGTRDLKVAQKAAYQLGILLMARIPNFDNIRSYTVQAEVRETPNEKLSRINVTTDGTPEDNEGGLKALALMFKANESSGIEVSSNIPDWHNHPSLINQNIGRNSITVEEACLSYINQRDSEVALTTVNSWRTTFSLLTKMYGALKLMDITQEQISFIFKQLNDLKRARKTIENYSVNLNTLFSWYVSNGTIIRNPVVPPKFSKKIAAQIDKERKIPRLPYNADDLAKIFDREALIEMSRPDSIFLPIIGAFTGARISSICALKVQDFFEYEPSKWQVSFQLESDKVGKYREIPLHPIVIDSGLIEYIQMVGQYFGSKDVLIFPYLRETQGKLGHYPSRLFSERKMSLGLPRGKDFHSFRTSIITCTKKLRADPTLKRVFVGHSSSEKDFDDVHSQNYEKDEYSVQELEAEILPKIDYFKWVGFQFNVAGIYADAKIKSKFEALIKAQQARRSQKAAKLKNTS